ncbi:hypothetical protein [Micromonospora carbonacea]|uniref:hypothetical protein n=1 Tax=Micromonospora carbonacea TaxID=47853 RepID=UPI00371CB704
MSPINAVDGHAGHQSGAAGQPGAALVDAVEAGAGLGVNTALLDLLAAAEDGRGDVAEALPLDATPGRDGAAARAAPAARVAAAAGVAEAAATG